MKKSLIIMAVLLLFAGLLTATEVIIGSGTTYNSSTAYPAVYGGFYKNAREQYLVTAGEFAANGGGAGNVTSIAFNVYALNGCGALPNFTIRMGHTTLSALTTNFETGLTQVFTTASYTPIVGWNTHTFDTPFNWDGTSNVIVEVTFDFQASYTYNTSTYYTATGSEYKALYYRSDTVAWNTVTTGTQSYNRPNMKYNMAAGGAIAPFPAVLVSPTNGATYQPLTTTLNWANGGGDPTEYKVYFGTTNPPPYVTTLTAPTTTYAPTLAYGTPYFWKIVPHNALGDAANCPVWSFTTTQEGVVMIGNGTDVTPMLPINAYYGYTYSQVIYHQSEIGGACLIPSLAYYWNGAAASTVSNDWVVYMGHTSNTAFASTTDWVPLTNLTQVFAGTVDMTATAGWITITLPTPFAYNGSDNLVIAVDENEAGYDYPYGQFYCTTTPDVRALLYYNDSTNPDPAAPPAAMYMRTSLANVLLNTSPIQAGEPAAPLLTYPGNGDIGLPVGGFDLTWQPDLINGGEPDYYALYLSQDEETLFSDYFFDSITETSFNPVTDGGMTFAYDQQWYWTVEAVNTFGSAVADPAYRFTIISPPPQIAVAPTSLTQTLEHGFTATQQITISNAGGLPLNFSMGFTDTTTRGTAITPPDQMAPPVADPNSARFTEKAPFIGPQVESGNRALFDLQFLYPTFLNDGEYGIATDGSYFYTSDWSSTTGQVDIAKYALDGTYIEEFGVVGASNCRDLTYDGTYFYGAAAATTIYIMDFTTHTLIGTITAPVAVRAITYDPDLDAFWVGNGWNADIRCIDRTGAQISALVPAVASFGGLAYDNLSGPTPTLWGNTQNGTCYNEIVQIDMTTGAVLQSLDVTDALVPGVSSLSNSAGGMEICTGVVPGFATLVCNAQNLAFYGLELCPVSSWCSANPHAGSVPGYGSLPVDVLFDATELSPGVYNGYFTINHNAPAYPPVNVPVQLTVTGIWPAEFSMAPASYNYGDVEQLNSSTTQFTITNTGGSTPLLNIAAGGIYLTGDAEGNFSVNAPGLPVSLDHNDTYTFDVTFTPQTTGAKTATLNVADNLTRVVHTAALSGNGVEEEIGVIANLQATVQNYQDVHLTWIMTSGEVGTPGWIFYDSGTNVDGIGTGGAVTFDVAMKFDSATMYPYAGMQVTQFMYYPRSASSTYTMEIWTGLDGNIGPSTLVYSQPLTQTAMSYNTVALTTPYTISGSEAVWIGYNVVVPETSDDYYPAGCDGGPAIVNYGDLIYFGGTWSSMYTAYGLNYNWNLRAYVDNPTLLAGRAPLLSIPVINTVPDKDFLRNNRLAAANGSATANPRVLRGYNVYRDNTTTPINTTLVPTTSYWDYTVPYGTHNYWVQGVYYSGNSNLAGPVQVVLTAPVPYELPFVEEWNEALYTTQEWATSATNWTMDTTNGDPTPCAIFSWSPQITNYTEYLTSHALNGVGQTNVTLSFELALNNYSTAAENWMAAEVWNGTAWNTVATWSSFDNAGAGWGFTYYSYDISAYAAGNQFKIRFKAYGEDSYEINYWYIDNINVTVPPLTLPAPVCTITPDDPDVLVQWDAVPGAEWYGVYSATDPYGTYTYQGYLPASYTGFYWTAGTKDFFKVTAGAGPLPRGHMLNRGIQH